jgi:nucleotide-binding universal stress UspA family protein
MIRLTHILCPIDFSDTSRHAIARAAAIARWSGAGVTVLHVVVSRPAMDVPAPPLEARDRTRLLDEMDQLVAAAAPGLHARYRVLQAERPDAAILETIDDIDPDLLIMGTHGRSGFRHLLLGSVTEKVIRRAACPTLIVPPAAPDAAVDAALSFRQIVCPVDFSPSSEAAVTHAVYLAASTGASLLLLHLVELPPVMLDIGPSPDFAAAAAQTAKDADRRLHQLVPATAREFCTVESRVVEGRAHGGILRAVAERGADLIVMGVHGRGVVDLLLFGSTTHHVLHEARCPVLIVHSQDGAAARRRYPEAGIEAEPRPKPIAALRDRLQTPPPHLSSSH